MTPTQHDLLVSALELAFRRGGAATDEVAHVLAEAVVADPVVLAALGRALSEAARAGEAYRQSEGLVGKPESFRSVGAALEAIAFTRGVHHLDERMS